MDESYSTVISMLSFHINLSRCLNAISEKCDALPRSGVHLDEASGCFLFCRARSRSRLLYNCCLSATVRLTGWLTISCGVTVALDR